MKTDGTVWGWGQEGSNSLLQELGGLNDVPYPVQIGGNDGLQSVRQVSIGSGVGAAVLTSGAVRVWGSNTYGTYGNGQVGGYWVPGTRLVLGVPSIDSLMLGIQTIVARESNGSIWGWGRAVNGQLGDGGPPAAGYPPNGAQYQSTPTRFLENWDGYETTNDSTLLFNRGPYVAPPTTTTTTAVTTTTEATTTTTTTSTLPPTTTTTTEPPTTTTLPPTTTTSTTTTTTLPVDPGPPPLPADLGPGLWNVPQNVLKEDMHAALVSDPVDSRTGAFTMSLSDLMTESGRGPSFSLERSYDSTVAGDGWFGPGWGSTLGQSLVENPATGAIVWRAGLGSSVTFAKTGATTYTAPRYVIGSLTKTASGWDLTGADQMVTRFDTAGRLIAMVDRSGQALTYACNAAGKLITATDAGGAVHTFTYGTTGVSKDRLVKVSSQDLRVVKYTYSLVAGKTRLLSVTDPRLKIATMVYDTNGYLMKVVDALGNSEAINTYDSVGRVMSQADALGNVSTFSWDTSTQTLTFTDAAGAVSNYDYNGGLLAQSVGPTGQTSQSFDVDYNIKSFTDQAGAKWDATYDSNGNMLTRKDPLGRNESWTYDNRNNPLTHTDVTGVATTNTYDPQSRLLTSTRGVTSTSYAWNPNGTLASSTDALGRTISYAYNAAGQKINETSPGGAVTTWEYDTSGRVARMVPPRGNLPGAVATSFDTLYRYDKSGNLVLQNEPGGRSTKYVYDDAGRMTTMTAPDGGVTTYTYNAAGEQISVTGPDGGVTTSEYSVRGERISQTDAYGAKTTWTYDAAGRMVAMVEPRGNVAGANPADYRTTYTYDPTGKRLKQTDALGRVTSWSYDSLGRVVTETRPDGSTTTTYDPVLAERKVTTTDQAGRTQVQEQSPEGWAVSSADVAGRATTHTYDAVGNRLSTVTPDGARTTWTYDNENRVASMTDPRGNVLGANAALYKTTYTYDIEGHQTSIRDPLGRVTNTTYDTVGRTDIVTDPAGKTMNYAYDLGGHVKQINATGRGATKYVYDTAGRLTTRTDQLLKTTTYEYQYGRLMKQTDPLGRFITFEYDKSGNQTAVTDAVANAAGNWVLGTKITDYDQVGRPTGTRYPDGSSIAFRVYDSAGRVERMVDSISTTEYTYDSLNRVTSTTNALTGVVMSYGYDISSNITSFNDGNVAVGRTFDVMNRLTSVAENGVLVASYTYDIIGQPTLTEYAGGVKTAKSFDAAGQLVSIVNSINGSTLRSYSFTRDSVGSPTKIETTGIAGAVAGESQLFTYDTAGRLSKQCWTATVCAASNQTTWAYDVLGRRTSEKIGSALPTTYAYNANGDQTLAPGVVSTFNAAHQTTSVQTASGTVTYAYDGSGNRVTSTVNGVTTRFDWDNVTNSLPEVTAESENGNVTRRYVQGNGLARIYNGTTASTPLTDQVGTVTHLVSTTGTLQAQYLTGPYGTNKNTTVTDPAVAGNPIRYTGQYTDPTTKNVHLRARNYSPTTGAFTQVDPMPINAGTALESAYVYAYGSPAQFVDPSGRRASEPDVGNAIVDRVPFELALRAVKKDVAPPCSGFKLITEGGIYGCKIARNARGNGMDFSFRVNPVLAAALRKGRQDVSIDKVSWKVFRVTGPDRKQFIEYDGLRNEKRGDDVRAQQDPLDYEYHTIARFKVMRRLQPSDAVAFDVNAKFKNSPTLVEFAGYEGFIGGVKKRIVLRPS